MIRRVLNAIRDRRDGAFRFHDGRKSRTVDPFTVFRALKCHPTFDWAHHPNQAQLECNNPDERRFEAVEITVNAIRDVFGIPEFDKGGLTEERCLNLLGDFRDYCEGQKKSGNPQATSPPATESGSSESSSRERAGSDST